jgi:hypothetical protein
MEVTPQEVFEYWFDTEVPTVCPKLINDDWNVRLIETFVFANKRNVFSPENLTAAVQDSWVASQLHIELTPEEKAAKAEQERIARVAGLLQQTINVWLERHCPTGLLASNGEPFEGDVHRLIEYLKRNCGDRYENGTITVEDLNAAVRTLTESNVLTYFDRSPEAMRIRGSQQDETARDTANRRIAKTWLKERCPKHLLNDKLVIGTEFAKKMNRYLEANYRGVWNLDNLDSCVKYLQLRGELPSAPKSAGIKPEEIAANKLHNSGVLANTGRMSHAEKTETQNESMHDAAKRLFGDIRKLAQPSAAPAASKEKIRVLPLDATPQQLKNATPAELKVFLQRKQGRR